MGKSETLAITGNAAVLAVLHTGLGVFMSYVFYYIFDEFNDAWKKRSGAYKIADVTVEIMLIAIIGYWTSEYTEYLSPVFPMSKAKEIAVDSWVSGIFFIIALFLFLDDFTAKLKYLQNEYFEKTFTAWLPQYGSLIDMNLSYTPITEEDKKAAKKKEKVISGHPHEAHAE
jgi:hypothetical protein